MGSAPVFFTIPAGTPPTECRGRNCRATVYWIETAKGKRMLVDPDVDGGHEPSEHEDGQGVAHWADCPDRDSFRKAKR